MIRLLVVEDSALMRKLMAQIFSSEGDFELAFAKDGVEALALMETLKPDVVTLDVHMPNMDGLACLERIMLEHPCPVVMVSSLTGEGAEETLAALEAGAVDFIAKPRRAISLEIENIAPLLVEKVRLAATARPKRSHRLTERLRARIAQPRVERSSNAPSPLKHLSVHNAAPGMIEGLVLIGTSTGGPPALDVVLSGLPATFPWPILVAQHMPASFTGPLSRRLDKLCALSVVEVSEQIRLEAGTVYLARGDADMVVSQRGGSLFAMPVPMDSARHWHPSVERLVESAMAHLSPERLIGVLMTGMGTDGAVSMTALREAGGRTIAEAKNTAVVWGMPGELVRREGAGHIDDLDSIPSRLMEMLS